MSSVRAVLVSLILFATHAEACINTYEEDLLVMMQRDDPEEIAEKIRELEAANAKAPTLQSNNDLAVAYLLAGEYDRAIALLTALDKEHPGVSWTAANLGTALELAGKNAEALRWIEAGIERDPNDHQGTEWLHARILEAKIALEKDPAWLATHNVLGIDFGDETLPRMPATLSVDRRGRPSSLEDIEKAMDYQLQERLRFVTAPDPIVANLYRTRADVATLQKAPQAADYYLAATFFGAKDHLTADREQQLRVAYSAPSSPSKAVRTETPNVWAIVATVAASLALLAGLVFRFMWKPSRKIPG